MSLLDVSALFLILTLNEEKNNNLVGFGFTTDPKYFNKSGAHIFWHFGFNDDTFFEHIPNRDQS